VKKCVIMSDGGTLYAYAPHRGPAIDERIDCNGDRRNPFHVGIVREVISAERRIAPVGFGLPGLAFSWKV
jgi:hypothetical protein